MIEHKHTWTKYHYINKGGLGVADHEYLKRGDAQAGADR